MGAVAVIDDQVINQLAVSDVSGEMSRLVSANDVESIEMVIAFR